MSSKRLFYVLMGLNIAVLLAIGGGAYALNKLLGSVSHTIVSQRLKVQTLDAESNALGGAKKDVKQYSQLAGIAQSIVPQDKDQAQAVREIVNIAATNGIQLGSITFPSSTLGTTAGAATLSTSQLLPVKGIAGVYSLEISVQSDPAHTIPYNRMLDFLKGLENNRRTALVSDITITPDSKNSSNVSFNLILDEYIKP